MGKRKDGINPAEAERKKEALKRKKANAESRRAARDAALKRSSVSDLTDELERLSRLERSGQIDSHGLDRKKRLEKELVEAKVREKEKKERKVVPQAVVNIKGLSKIFRGPTKGEKGSDADEDGEDDDDDDSEEDNPDPYQERLKRREADSGAYTYDDKYRSVLPLALLPGAGSKETLKKIKRGEALDPVLAAERAAKEDAAGPTVGLPKKKSIDDLPPPPEDPPGLAKPPADFEITGLPYGNGLEVELPAEEVTYEIPAPAPPMIHHQPYAPHMMPATPFYPAGPPPAHMMPYMRSAPYVGGGGGVPPPPPPRPAPVPGAGGTSGIHPDRAFDRERDNNSNSAPSSMQSTAGPYAGVGDVDHSRRNFAPQRANHAHPTSREKFELDPMDPNPESAHEAWLDEQHGARKRFKGPGGAHRPPPITNQTRNTQGTHNEAQTKQATTPAPAPAVDPSKPKQATIKPSFMPTHLLVRNRPAVPPPQVRPRTVSINAAPDVAMEGAPSGHALSTRSTPAAGAGAPPPPPPRPSATATKQSTDAAYEAFMKEIGSLGE